MVMAVGDPVAADVVFLVEATTNLESSFNDMKSNYITQILNHFNPAFNDDPDMAIDCNDNLYTIVSFTSTDAAPHPSVSCTQATSNTHEIQDAFSYIQFTQCWNFGTSHITEALAMGLQVLDECKKFRTKMPPVTERHIILICNSEPYDVPTREVRPYLGLKADDLVDKIAEREIHFSILSPRRRPKLFKLYKRVSDPTLPMINHAVEARHHILVDSIVLKEQPKVEKPKHTVIELDNSPKAETGNTIPPTTLTTNSILVTQLNDAKASRPTPSSTQVTSTAASTKMTQSAQRTHDSAPLLTEILGSPTSITKTSTSDATRNLITSMGPQTSTMASNVMSQPAASLASQTPQQMLQNRQTMAAQQQAAQQAAQQQQQAVQQQQQQAIKVSSVHNINQMSMANQPNPQLVTNPMSIANSQPPMATNQINANQPQMNTVNSMPIANQQTNQQMIGNPMQMANNQLMTANQQMPASMQQGMGPGNAMNTSPAPGMRAQLQQNPQLRHPGQFTRTINPNQIGGFQQQNINAMSQMTPQQQQLQFQQQQPQQQQQPGNMNNSMQQQLQQQHRPQLQQQQQPMPQQSQIGALGKMLHNPQQPNFPGLRQQQPGNVPQQAGQQPQQANLQQQPGQPQQQYQPQQMLQQGLQQPTPQQSIPQQQIPQQQQFQPVWQGKLEYSDKKYNQVQGGDRVLLIQAQLMADVSKDGDFVSAGGLSRWPDKVSIYPIPDIILSQSMDVKRHLADSRKLSVFADVSSPNTPLRLFISMMLEKNMAGVVNLSQQQEYKIMVLIANRGQNQNSAGISVKALLPKEQDKFYGEFKRSVHLYKEKSRQAAINRTGGMQQQQQQMGTMAPGQPQNTGMMQTQPMGGHINQPGQMSQLQRIANPAAMLQNQQPQRPLNQNMQNVMMNSTQMPGMMGGQLSQNAMQQQQQPLQQQNRQMAVVPPNQQMVNPQLQQGQRPMQNQQMMMRPQQQMMTQQQQQILQQQRMAQSQQQQPNQQQQMMMQQQPNNQPMMMGGQNQSNMSVQQQGGTMGAGTLDDLQGLF